MNDTALQAFMRALREDTDLGVRLVAVEALRTSCDARAVPALVQALRDESPQIRQTAILALGDIGVPAIAALSEALHSPDALLRTGAASILGALSSQHPEVTDATLLQALRDEEPEVRRLAAYALGEKGQVAESAYAALIEALRDKEGTVRRVAAEALGKLVPVADRALAGLTTAMRDAEPEVRRAAAEALKQITVG